MNETEGKKTTIRRYLGWRMEISSMEPFSMELLSMEQFCMELKGMELLSMVTTAWVNVINVSARINSQVYKFCMPV